MSTGKNLKTDKPFSLSIGRIICMLLCFLIGMAGAGCGGGGSDSPSSTSTPDTSQTTYQWTAHKIEQQAVGGLISPRITAVLDDLQMLHLVYFVDSASQNNDYDIMYKTYDLNQASSENSVAQSVITVDNCKTLSLTLDSNQNPLIAYQGGEIRECGSEQQSDAMVNVMQANTWQEYTAAIGEVERNPVFTDGLAGNEVSGAVDENGDIHVCYQFLYEGCDAMNFKYPDLCYVKLSGASPQNSALIEETVEGNQYGTTNTQNSVGYDVKLVLDHNNQPVVFYYAQNVDSTQGLRVARRLNGTWQISWIETGCEVWAISAACATDSGVLGVAYYVKKYTNGQDDVHVLRYAQDDGTGWQVQMVDDSTRCGNYPSLAFDQNQHPAIAYYDMESHSGYALKNLKLARYDQGIWEKQTISQTGDIGLYNSLIFDQAGMPAIVTYSATDRTIYVFKYESVTL